MTSQRPNRTQEQNWPSWNILISEWAIMAPCEFLNNYVLLLWNYAYGPLYSKSGVTYKMNSQPRKSVYSSVWYKASFILASVFKGSICIYFKKWKEGKRRKEEWGGEQGFPLHWKSVVADHTRHWWLHSHVRKPGLRHTRHHLSWLQCGLETMPPSGPAREVYCLALPFSSLPLRWAVAHNIKSWPYLCSHS